MQAVLKRAALFAEDDAPVVLLGESGSGKEVVARTLHASSPRSDRPFLAVNVAALPAQLLESELFGHARGAFTGATAAKAGLFEAADGGTLFLDEIAEMPLELQPKLLRALQDGEIRRVGETRSFGVDVRIVCATHRDLAAWVERGTFRRDLYYRLAVLVLEVPALRERKEDIVPLAEMFLAQEKRGPAKLNRAAQDALLAYAWPGNVRELANSMRYAGVVARWGTIGPDHLPESVIRAPLGQAGAPTLRTLAEVEREHVQAVLEACGGSHSEAASVLGIGRTTLWRKLRRHDDA
jgi:transcriptional regulator with PAS, ATPase and Fis domain